MYIGIVSLLLSLSVQPSTITLPETVIHGTAPKATEAVWVCGTPRKLENDAVQTVKECSYFRADGNGNWINTATRTAKR